jgi:lipid II:glycine glycyltransferase (peptidoglycan interpeptide bridge formation enzyme)
MNLKKIKSIDADDCTIFSSEKYLKTQSDEYYYLSSEDDKMIIPVVIKKKLIFKYAVFHSGLVKSGGDHEKEKDFLNSAVKLLKKEKIDFISHPSSYVLFDSYPDNSVYAPFGTYLIDLTRPEENLWDNLHQKHRNVIRNAMKNGVVIRRDKSDPEAIFEMLAGTMERSGMGFSGREYFHRIMNSLGDNIEVFSAYKDDAVQGCAVFPFNRYSSYYLWGGSIENPFTGALNLLQWEAMRYFKSLGVKRYNFTGARISPEEGSKLEGIQRFKSRFGGELMKGYLWKMPLNPFKYGLFNLVIRMRNFGKSQSKDIIDQERFRNNIG